jgi:hypothetical protein
MMGGRPVADDKSSFTFTNAQCIAVLRRFGVIPAENFDPDSRLRQTLSDLQSLLDLLPSTSPYTLLNWAEILFNEQDVDLNHVLTSANRLLNDATRKADNAMAMVYLTLNLLGFILSIAAMQNFDAGFLAEDTGSTVTASGWNYIDTTGGLITAAKQLHQGEYVLGFSNLASSLQLAACTISANLAKYTTLINASAATVSALMGFSFAACMLVSCCNELYEVHKANNRIDVLETNLRTETDEHKIKLLQKTIYIEKAHRENHVRSAKSWAACTIAMTAVAVIAYAALSGLTFGALPAATVIIAAAALLTGAIRKWWVSNDNHVDHVKTAFKSHLPESINEIVARNPLGLKLDLVVTLNENSLFGTKKLSFKNYLDDLLIKDPNKLEKIVKAIKENNLVELQKVLQTQRDTIRISGETRGTQLLNAVLKAQSRSSEVTPPPAAIAPLRRGSC